MSGPSTGPPIWSPEATNDLTEIALYIGIEQDRPEAADRIIDGLTALCNKIAGNPTLGERVHEFPSLNLKRFSHRRRWVVYYRVKANRVQIVRVVDGARKISDLFG